MLNIIHLNSVPEASSRYKFVGEVALTAETQILNN